MTGKQAALEIARSMAFPFSNEPPPDDVCPGCGGDGWYVGHEDECYDTGDCHCSGAQVQCECAS